MCACVRASSVRLSVRSLSVLLSVSVCPSVRPSVCPSVRLSVRLSVCLTLMTYCQITGRQTSDRKSAAPGSTSKLISRTGRVTRLEIVTEQYVKPSGSDPDTACPGEARLCIQRQVSAYISHWLEEASDVIRKFPILVLS